jgi:hypothetical protein
MKLFATLAQSTITMMVEIQYKALAVHRFITIPVSDEALMLQQVPARISSCDYLLAKQLDCQEYYEKAPMLRQLFHTQHKLSAAKGSSDDVRKHKSTTPNILVAQAQRAPLKHNVSLACLSHHL